MEELKAQHFIGFEAAIIGLDTSNQRYIMSKDKCIEICMKADNLSYDQALDWLYFNVFEIYAGEFMPVFIWEQNFDQIAEIYGLL